MAIFRSRAIDATNRSSALDVPLLLPYPQLRRHLRTNLIALGDALLPRRSGRVVRTQERRQQDPTECGAVSLAIVLQHHGCHVPLSSLRRACGVSRDGSDAANLVRAAQLFGLKAKGFKKGLEALKAVRLPAIVFWNFDHFLVLDGLEQGRYWINDPATGRRCVELEEFDRCYTGVVLTFEPGPEFEPSPPAPGAAALLWHRLQQPRSWLLPALLVSATAAGALLSLLPGSVGTGRLSPWPWLLPLLLAALAFPPLAQALSRQLQRQGSRRMQQQLLSLPGWVIQQHFSADLSGRQRLLPELTAFLRDHGAPALPWLLACLLWGGLLVAQQPWLALLIWSGVAAFALTSGWCERHLRSWDAQQRMASRRPATILQGGLQDPCTLKASALERDLFVRWSGMEALAAQERQRLAASRDLQGWIPQMLGWALPVAVVAAAVGQAAQGQPLVLPVLLIALGLGLVQRRSRVLLRHWSANRDAIETLATLEAHPRDPLLEEPMEVPPTPLAVNRAAHLELDAVSFGYVPVQPPLIANLTLRVQAGERIAIVGGSASGKSTLARLIAGLEQPTAGVVKLNGRPLLEWPRQQRLRAIAMVQQGLPLLPCSVRDNLTFWNSTTSQAELEAACAAAAILERIMQLPHGFDTQLQEAGDTLSGGELQRLQIAQALLQQPSLLILDEATAALDALTERAVEDALRQLPCTQIVVAHRLSTIRDADSILVLEQGKLVQQGSHAQLMQQGSDGPYQQLLLLEGDAARMEPSAMAGNNRDA